MMNVVLRKVTKEMISPDMMAAGDTCVGIHEVLDTVAAVLRDLSRDDTDDTPDDTEDVVGVLHHTRKESDRCHYCCVKHRHPWHLAAHTVHTHQRGMEGHAQEKNVDVAFVLDGMDLGKGH